MPQSKPLTLSLTEDFKNLILEQHNKKKTEYKEWKEVVTNFLQEKEERSKV